MNALMRLLYFKKVLPPYKRKTERDWVPFLFFCVQEIYLGTSVQLKGQIQRACSVYVFWGCVYPICIRHEETFRHPWASSGIVVHQVGVSSLKNREIVIQLKLFPCS